MSRNHGWGAEPTEQDRQGVKLRRKKSLLPRQKAVVNHVNNEEHKSVRLCPLGSSEESFIMFIIATIVINFITIRIFIYSSSLQP